VDIVRVAAYGDPILGELRRGLLEAAGITVMMKGGAESPYRLGPVYLFVAADDEMRARVILEEAERTSDPDRSDADPAADAPSSP
jgi:putative signal transducing protein